MRTHALRAGFTLIELMIALTLGALISAAVVSVFISSNRSYSDNERSARIQGNGRAALYLLANDLRHANFWGPLVTMTDLGAFPSTALSGPCSAWAVANPATGRFLSSDAPQTDAPFASDCIDPGQLRAGTSAVAIKRVGNRPLAFNDSGFVNGQLFLRAHSLNGQLLVKGSGDGNSAPGAGLSDWPYQPKVYFIRDYWQTAGDGIPSLCVIKIDPDDPDAMHTQCLVQAIDDLHIEYGIDDSGNGVPDRYQAAPPAADMAKVVTLQVYVLARDLEPDPLYRNQRSYQLGSKTVAVDDHVRRAVFTTTLLPQNQRMSSVTFPRY